MEEKKSVLLTFLCCQFMCNYTNRFDCDIQLFEELFFFFNFILDCSNTNRFQALSLMNHKLVDIRGYFP